MKCAIPLRKSDANFRFPNIFLMSKPEMIADFKILEE